jgi:hypothetical protein
MKKYFIHNGKDQQGPFTIEELRQNGITFKTMVWYEGLSNWKEAENIDELKGLLTASPPPFEKTSSINQTIEKAKKVLDKDYVSAIETKIPNKIGKRIFKYALIVFAAIGLLFLVNQFLPIFGDNEKNRADDFLVIQYAQIGEYYSSNHGSKYYVTGKLVNNAVSTTYKDVKLEVEFKTKSGTTLIRKTVIIYQAFPPIKESYGSNWEQKFEARLEEDPPYECDLYKTQFAITDADVAQN